MCAHHSTILKPRTLPSTIHTRATHPTYPYLPYLPNPTAKLAQTPPPLHPTLGCRCVGAASHRLTTPDLCAVDFCAQRTASLPTIFAQR